MASGKPLVIALHGGGGHGAYLRGTDRLLASGGGERLLCAVSQRHHRRVLGFSATGTRVGAVPPRAKNGVDDVGFIERLLDRVAAAWPVDLDRIFVVGYSNGGMLAHRLALEWGPDRVAGLAVFAGPVGPLGGPPRSYCRAPTPTLVIHGTADDRLSVDGSLPDRRGNELLGAMGTAVFWANRNGCEEPPETVGGGAELERTFWCSGSGCAGAARLAGRLEPRLARPEVR